jgi:hypothetical protein
MTRSVADTLSSPIFHLLFFYLSAISVTVLLFLLVQHQSLDNFLLTPSRHPDVLPLPCKQLNVKDAWIDGWQLA